MIKKILVIEDEEFVRENIIELLDAEGLDVIAAENGRIGLDLAKQQQPDLILCDVMMPELDGYGVLTALRQSSFLARIPFIFLTAKASKTDFRQGMELGADDYLTKPFTRAELLGAIASRVKKQAAVKELYDTELQQAKKQLNYLLYHDSLTELPNQLSLQEQFQHVKPPDTEREVILGVICLSLDRFSQINDNLGDYFGDLLLRAVADRIKTCVGSQDIVARLNADKFAIIISKIEHKSDAVYLVENILKSIAKTFIITGREIFITASIGLSFYRRDGRELEELLNHANKGMIQAKQQGGNQYQVYTPAFNISSLERLSLQTSLRHALEREELRVYYQPQIDLEQGTITGAEALIRWKHPEYGLVSPVRFIPLAEETGLIIPIGEWVLSEACKQVKVWQNSGFPSLRISVNLSGRQFSQIDLRQRLFQILAECNFHPQYLDLELTESMLVQNTEVAIRRLEALKSLGVKIAIDDFGTGYSSLSYLQQFPFDTLKIDRCFIHNIVNKENNAAITKAIIQMAKSLDLKLVAEGVETEAELSFVCQHHCDLMQGYLFSPALSAQDFSKLLNTGKRLSVPTSYTN